MSKDGTGGSSGVSDPRDYDAPSDQLFRSMIEQRDMGGVVMAQINLNGQELSGPVNSMDRSGANHLAFKFEVAPGVSIEWRGRRIQTKVEDVAPDACQISDENTPLLLITYFD